MTNGNGERGTCLVSTPISYVVLRFTICGFRKGKEEGAMVKREAFNRTA